MENEASTDRDQITPPAPRPGSCLPWALLAIVVVPLLALILGATAALGGVAATWRLVNNAVHGRLVLQNSLPPVIDQVRSLNRLEAASYTIEKVIEGGNTHGNPVLDALLGDRLLFIAHGEVIAGADLSQLQEGDVQLASDGRSAIVRLPAARILTHRLDNDLSRVYDRSTGILARPDPQLETKVRQDAENQIVQAACQGGILMQANANAEAEVRSLLAGLRIEQVQFLPAVPGPDTGCEPGY